VRVRTYGFPGCFTRPPGTSTRHHPHEPTTSKPVVPRDVLLFQCTACGERAWTAGRARARGGRRRRGRPHTNARRARCKQKRDAVPSHFEVPGGSGPRAFPCGWRGLTPQWPRSLRLGSASGFNLARAPMVLQPQRKFDPAPSGKFSSPADPRAWVCGRIRARACAGTSKGNAVPPTRPCNKRHKAVRQCLEVLPQ
jgi:hypothetical protein